jgi:hypothetical protein
MNINCLENERWAFSLPFRHSVQHQRCSFHRKTAQMAEEDFSTVFKAEDPGIPLSGFHYIRNRQKHAGNLMKDGTVHRFNLLERKFIDIRIRSQKSYVVLSLVHNIFVRKPAQDLFLFRPHPSLQDGDGDKIRSLGCFAQCLDAVDTSLSTASARQVEHRFREELVNLDLDQLVPNNPNRFWKASKVDCLVRLTGKNKSDRELNLFNLLRPPMSNIVSIIKIH